MKPPHTIQKYSIAKTEDDTIVNLAINENLFPTPPIVQTTFGHQTKRLFEYPYRQSLMSQLLSRICDYHHKSICPENVLVTNGSDMAFKCLFETYLNSNSKVLVAAPNYPHIANFLQQQNIQPEYVKCVSTHDALGPLKSKLQQDSDWNLVYLSNPNMPMGYCVPGNDIKALVTQYPSAIFIVDEAYAEYAEDGMVINNTYDFESLKNLFVTRTFSKFFALAALRLGYVVSNKENIDNMRPFFNDKSVLNVSLAVASAALQSDSLHFYATQLEAFFKVKSLIFERLSAIKRRVGDANTFDFNLRSGMFYLVVCKNPQELCDLFKTKNIMVRNKSDEIPGAVRISIAPVEITNTVLDCLDEYFSVTP